MTTKVCPVCGAVPPEKLLLSVTEAAAILDLSYETVYTMIREGEFPPARLVRRTWKVSRPLLDEWLSTPQAVAS